MSNVAASGQRLERVQCPPPLLARMILATGATVVAQTDRPVPWLMPVDRGAYTNTAT